ncbi:hemopexin domain protein [Ceratobasidium sp. AG-Ba]|nr:hemopexin domain protein [Ceratobasidium sp. AG-Ba]QRW09268.1 hemopexin domain protein [Ceratobasidium sp. AG-Ba]
MSNSLSLFEAATIPFFRSAPEADLMRRLEEALQNNAHYSGRGIEWRTDSVTDFRGYHVPAAAERLVRWDRRHPDVVFNEGFRPHVAPADESAIVPANSDLGAYVDNNVESVFVGTARYYRNPDTHRPTRWVPRNIGNMFDLGTGNRFFIQHEIAFPGGIRPEFIRTARQYDASGHVVAIWANPNFDISASGGAHPAELAMLPDPVCGSSVDIHYWMGPPEDRPPQRMLRRLRPRVADEPLHQDGAPAEDQMMTDTCALARPTRASFLNPANTKEAYFFADTQYVLIKVEPGTRNDTRVNGPKHITQEWPSLKAAHFGKVDTILPTGDDNEAYFFAQDEYALIDVAPGTNSDKLINGPKKIATEWPSLKAAGCKIVDAVLPFPRVKKQAYFFCGAQYTVIHYAPGTTDDYIVQTPRPIAENWLSLADNGFTRVDSALPHPDNIDEAYFFYKDRYVLVKISLGTTGDKVVNGPNWVRDQWPSLKAAKFYGQEPSA